MAFNSITFVIFLTGVTLFAYLVPRKFRYIWLLVCSYGFYLYSPDSLTKNIPALVLLIFATLVSYGCAIGIDKSKTTKARKGYLVASLIACLGLLAVLKYLGFFAGMIETVVTLAGGSLAFPRMSLILPLGISYYTLQTVSYAIDIYRNKISAEKNIALYALYVSFFPGIVSGPINRAPVMLPQYKNPMTFDYSRLAGGLFRVLWGIVKKMVIADSIGIFTATVFADPSTYYGPHLFLALLLFPYQLYTDFNGICDIAIGSAQMLGFTFMENFNRPFAAKTFADLWRRWHISLTSFFREYLYYPLGGNRCSTPRWIFNTLVIFLVSGLWHGAHISYLIWGLLNGFVMLGGRFTATLKEKTANRIPIYRKPKVRGVFQRIFVYLLFAGCMAFFAFALFHTPVLEWFAKLPRGWRALFAGTLPVSLEECGLPFNTILVLAGSITLIEVIEMFAITKGSTIANWVRSIQWYIRWPLYYLLLIGLFAFGVFGQSSFIYQQY